MSRKHFEAAAAEIKAMYVKAASQEALSLGYGVQMQHRAEGAEDLFVSIASQFNPRFDASGFRQACRP
jgi:hypothetical protein